MTTVDVIPACSSNSRRLDAERRQGTNSYGLCPELNHPLEPESGE